MTHVAWMHNRQDTKHHHINDMNAALPAPAANPTLMHGHCVQGQPHEPGPAGFSGQVYGGQ